MVGYLPDRWQAGLTTNWKSNTYGLSHPFALRYRRVNGTFYETIKIEE
jgi:hypothetical protein